MPDRRYGSREWKRLRLHILHRDNYTCQIRGPGCTLAATTVDHIVPTSVGGAFFDASNLRSSCSRCNYSAGSRIRATNVANQRLVEQQADELEQLRAEVADLRAELARRDEPQPSRQARTPAIH